MITRARVDTSGNTFRVIVPSPPGGVISSSVSTVYGNNNIVVGNVFGAVVQAGDICIGRGGNVNAAGVVVSGSGGLVRISATVPDGSHLSAKTTAASMNARAEKGTAFSEVMFTSKSGDVDIVGARRVNVHSISGDITAEGVEWMHANSTSGDIRAEGLAGNLDARSVSGNVRAHARVSCTVSASSVSGDVTVSKDPGVNVAVDASSVSGRVRTR